MTVKDFAIKLFLAYQTNGKSMTIGTCLMEAENIIGEVNRWEHEQIKKAEKGFEFIDTSKGVTIERE